jgi:dihydroorotase
MRLDSAVVVIDPDGDRHGVHALRADDAGRWRLAGPDPSAPGELYVSPGWVDLHAHVYDGVTQISVHPDRVGLDQGVHVLADAGSAGQATVRGLADYVLPRAETTVRVWLNIGSHGLVHLREVADPSYIDVDATLAAVAAHRDLVCGIKVRSSGLIVGGMGLQPLQLAKLVADEAGLPVMVHIGEAPPVIDDVLDLLGDGDVVTHCFHGKAGHPWHQDGTPRAALRRALDRGVRLDVGHGAASFAAHVARSAIAAGVRPYTISTDIHVRNVDGPVHDLASVMTKLIDCGMTLPEVIRCVTVHPRQVLGMTDPWLAADGTIQHATVFRVTGDTPPGRRYVDATGKVMTPGTHLVPVATIRHGVERVLRARSTGEQSFIDPGYRL